MKYLVVVDMQNDFICGALGTSEARAIVPYVRSLIESFDGEVLFTRDTHQENYLNTAEGRNLPVLHCVENTDGWQIHKDLSNLCKTEPINKNTFGSKELVKLLLERGDAEEITFVGLCTDICVISNALLVKAFLPEVPLIVDALGCAGVTPKSHENALLAISCCQIKIINR